MELVKARQLLQYIGGTNVLQADHALLGGDENPAPADGTILLAQHPLLQARGVALVITRQLLAFFRIRQRIQADHAFVTYGFPFNWHATNWTLFSSGQIAVHAENVQLMTASHPSCLFVSVRKPYVADCAIGFEVIFYRLAAFTVAAVVIVVTSPFVGKLVVVNRVIVIISEGHLFEVYLETCVTRPRLVVGLRCYSWLRIVATFKEGDFPSADGTALFDLQQLCNTLVMELMAATGLEDTAHFAPSQRVQAMHTLVTYVYPFHRGMTDGAAFGNGKVAVHAIEVKAVATSRVAEEMQLPGVCVEVGQCVRRVLV